MAMAENMESTMKPGMAGLVRQLYGYLGWLPLSLIQLMARCSLAVIFWRAGETKSANWDLTVQLFASEYKVPVLPPDVAATIAYTFEHYCPMFLVAGLATRVAVLPLIGMTLVIQTFVYPQAWPDHLTWMTMMLLLLSRGAGVVSLDHLAKKVIDRHM